MKQQFLYGFEALGEKEFGGSLLRGHARTARPISSKKPMHMVMRSSLAVGHNSFLTPKNSKKINEIIEKHAKESDVKIYRFANSGNHLHFLILAKSRKAFKMFIRAITGLIARAVLVCNKGSKLLKEFWDARPYTKIVEWGREFKNVCAYILQNTLEAIGFIPYKPRKKRKATKLTRRP